MPRLTDLTPKYRLHRASGQAVVTLNGKDFYLGSWKSHANRVEYDRIIGEWLAGGRTALGASGITIAELLASYKSYCERTYIDPDGHVAKSATNIRLVCRPLRRLYGATQAVEFGPLKLKALMDEYVKLGWCRKHINRSVGLVKQFFKWTVSNELVPPHVFQSLQTVDGLRRGRTTARESEPIGIATNEQVEGVIPFVSEQVAAMIRVELLTGMRPGEVCMMRACDLDMSKRVWHYRPQRHKTQNHGRQRIIPVGPKAQSLLVPFFKSNVTDYLFSPADAERERRTKLHADRKTPMSCGNRPGTNTKRSPKRVPGNVYSAAAYLRAIYRACHQAFPYPATMLDATLDTLAQTQEKKKARQSWRQQNFWSPNRLRHTAATRIREEFDVESAQVILGHANLRTTEIYAQKNMSKADTIMGAIG